MGRDSWIDDMENAVWIGGIFLHKNEPIFHLRTLI